MGKIYISLLTSAVHNVILQNNFNVSRIYSVYMSLQMATASKSKFG